MNGAVLQLGRATQRLRNEARRSCSSLVTTSFENDDQVAVITLNNPSKLNALTEDMGNELTATVGQLEGKKELRAAILTGAGKAFSAGGDLAWLLERHRDTAENNIRVMQVMVKSGPTYHQPTSRLNDSKYHPQEFYKKFLVMRNLPVPVIAAINGPAVGAGLCLAVGGADIRVASSSARFLGFHYPICHNSSNIHLNPKSRMGVTFTKLGLHPGMAATHFLPALVGPQVKGQLKAPAHPVSLFSVSLQLP